jgi:hypothetical protein
MAAIDIGPGAIDRDYCFGDFNGYTLISLDNPSNGSGVITSIEICCENDLTGVKIGTFYEIEYGTYTNRAYSFIGTVTAGSKQIFQVSIPIEVGDFLGIYFDNGCIDFDYSGAMGTFYSEGNYIGGGEHNYEGWSSAVISIYGERTEGIIVGPGAMDRDGWAVLGGNTFIARANPATVEGYIKTVNIWSNTNLTSVKIGTFYGAAPLHTNRDWENIGNITAGSKNIKTGLNIAIHVNDYLGIYASGDGHIEMSDSGGSGFDYKAGDQMGTGEQFYNYSSGNDISIRGFGGWAYISKVNGIQSANITKMSGVAVAAISKINGMTV